MKNTTFKRFALALGMAACSLSLLATPVATVPVHAATGSETTVQPRADIIQWIYKEEDGKLYKRLWNGSKAQWIGDWIYVRDL